MTKLLLGKSCKITFSEDFSDVIVNYLIGILFISKRNFNCKLINKTPNETTEKYDQYCSPCYEQPPDLCIHKPSASGEGVVAPGRENCIQLEKAQSTFYVIKCTVMQ